jgi:hypothetical protein
MLIMKKNISPAIFLLIILIIIYIVLTKCGATCKFFEKFNILRIFCKSINLDKENTTQYLTRSLLGIMKNASQKKKLVLKSPCVVNKYIPGTTDEYLKDDIKPVTDLVVSILNKSNKFEFIHTTYGNISVLKDVRNIYNFVYDMFLEDVKNLIMVHVKVNVVVFPNKNYKKFLRQNKLYDVFGSIFPIYNIGIPSRGQRIPLPTEVIPTACDVIRDSSIRIPDRLHPKYMYINTIEVLNSSLVVNPNRKCLGVGVNATKDKILDHTWIHKEHTPYIEKSKIRNKWIQLKSMPKNKEQWPCTEYSWEWNENGIYTPIAMASKECPGKRWSLTTMPLQPNYNPTLSTIPRNEGENAWMFEMARGIPSFPTGKSV